MPHIDGGPTDGPPGTALETATVNLTAAEAMELLESLSYWAEESKAGRPSLAWHTHIADGDGNELTIAISVDDPQASTASP